MTKTFEERFWEKVRVIEPEECWNWQAYVCRSTGYGRIGRNGSVMGAHRAAYTIVHGEIPKGMEVMHKCDNRRCVNPNHLQLGTHADNLKDMADKNRASSGERVWSTSLVDGDILAIRHRRASGEKTLDLADEYGVSRQQMDGICRGKFWSHIGGPLTARAMITDEIRREVLFRFSTGHSKKQIAAAMKLSISAVQKITQNKEVTQ